MWNVVEVAKLRRAFGDIRRGYSETKIGEDKIFIKHLASADRGEIDVEYVQFYERGLNKGLLTESAKLEELEKSGDWISTDEKALEEARTYIQGLYSAKANLHYPSQLPAMNLQIERANNALNKIAAKKNEFVGFTAESYANKRINELYIFYSLFRNKELSEPYVDRFDIELMEDVDLGKLVLIYNEKMSAIGESVVKKIAIARFFQDLYSLCDRDIYKFFGVPVADLTYSQSDLAVYARFFNFIFTDHKIKPPAEILEDPDKIIDWFNLSKNAEKELEKNGAVGEGNKVIAQSLVGATREDYKKMGMDMEGEGINAVAARHGGELNHAQMIALLNGRKV